MRRVNPKDRNHPPCKAFIFSLDENIRQPHNGLMPNRHIGKLPPRYWFYLNPYQGVRFTRCPKCDRPTQLRKFPLLIHVDPKQLLVLGKTCRYCSRCELIIAHQDLLEQQLAVKFSEKAPEVVGNKYFVIGTMAKKTWEKAIKSTTTMEKAFEHAADFKRHVTFKPQHFGWVYNPPKK